MRMTSIQVETVDTEDSIGSMEAEHPRGKSQKYW